MSETFARNEVKARLASGKPCYIMAIRHSRTIEVIGMAQATGHHAVYVDLQHSTISTDTAAQMMLAALAMGITPMVRLPGMNRAVCDQMLEGGALGIIMPDVRTAAEAAEVASWCRFPPEGSRGFLLAGAQTRFAAPDQQADRARLARETLVVVMLEHEAAFANAEAIAAVPGIDAMMIGANDLTSGMGMHGEYEHPRVVALFEHAIAAARRHGKSLIVGGIRKPEVVARYQRAGAAPCVVTGTDTAFLLAGATAQIEKFRDIGL